MHLVVETEDFGVTWQAQKNKIPAFAMCTGERNQRGIPCGAPKPCGREDWGARPFAVAALLLCAAVCSAALAGSVQRRAAARCTPTPSGGTALAAHPAPRCTPAAWHLCSARARPAAAHAHAAQLACRPCRRQAQRHSCPGLHLLLLPRDALRQQQLAGHPGATTEGPSSCRGVGGGQRLERAAAPPTPSLMWRRLPGRCAEHAAGCWRHPCRRSCGDGRQAAAPSTLLAAACAAPPSTLQR